MLLMLWESRVKAFVVKSTCSFSVCPNHPSIPNAWTLRIRSLAIWRTILTHICLFIKWMTPFPVLGVSGVRFYFYFIFDGNFCKQTSVDPDQTPRSDLGLYCLPRFQKRNVMLIWVNEFSWRFSKILPKSFFRESKDDERLYSCSAFVSQKKEKKKSDFKSRQ